MTTPSSPANTRPSSAPGWRRAATAGLFSPTGNAAMLELALRTAASTPRLLIVTDFDGTLAPLHDDPSAVAPAPAGVAALTTLCRIPDTHACVISGRSLADLWQRIPPVSGLQTRGSYGAESHAPSRDEKNTAPIDTLHARLSKALSSSAGRLERKSLGVAVHTRGLSRHDAFIAYTLARRAAGTLSGFREVVGHDVLDFTLSRHDKGLAIREEIDLFAPTAVVVFGDDDEDERMFMHARPNPVTVRVGEGSTRAEFRVKNPEAAAQALARLSEFRTLWATENL